MIKTKSILLFWILFLIISCHAEYAEKETEDVLINETVSEQYFFIFNQEKEIRILEKDRDTIQSIFDSEIKNTLNLPIGKFNYIITENNELKLIFPNDYYQNKIDESGNFIFSLDTIIYSNNQIGLINILKENKINEVFIFPSQPDKHGQFLACYRCPNWMNEMHLYMSLHWREINSITPLIN